jgi:hypothetical protein
MSPFPTPVHRARRYLAATGLSIALLSSALTPASAQSGDDPAAPEARKTIRALRINPHAPNVDGRLNDQIWQKAEFSGGFLQKQPDEGEDPANRTEVAIVYDDEALYVGARMYSTDPDNIRSTVTRRDNAGTSEKILVSFDTYHNHRTAYTFGVSAAGVRVDYFHPSDEEYDRDFDFNPVWEARVERNATGWTAEMKIPFTQLRFARKNVQVWGVNMNRWVPTDNEDSYWVLVAKDDTGWASRMGEVHGISGIKPSRRVELLPYAVTDARFQSDIEDADPFNSSSELKGRMGGDLKMGIGPNLTLSGTINPDFGQVEADPAEVNLSPFETIFSERRPFFTEDQQKLEGGGATYFYSRRIGRRPSLSPDVDYLEQPEYTSILGAAKLTGRLNSGLNVGVLGAVTEREYAKTSVGGIQDEVQVEPLSGYGVVRLQQEFGKDASTIGMIVTGVERELDDNSELNEFLRSRAITGGTDWNLRFKGGMYNVAGNAGFSYIEGSESAISEAQTSSARYFQRPDADYVELDPSRTSMTGFKGSLWAEKNSGKHWLGGLGAAAESPEYELNDLGALGTADDIDQWAWIRYRENEPNKYLQEWWVNLYQGAGWNFGGDQQYTFYDLEASVTYKNFWGSWFGAEYFPAAQSDNLTRGGPSMGTNNWWNAGTDLWSSGKNKTTWFGWLGGEGSDAGAWGYWIGGGATFRPGSRWELTLEPNWTNWHNPRQYVDQRDDAGGGENTYDVRYLFSSVERTRLRATTRLNYSFTPDLSLEFYAEPFAASVRYYNFGELAAARSSDLRHYGVAPGTTIEETADGVYSVTDGPNSFTIEQEDFQSLSFRSNFVLRWEWSPGSTLFLVWQMNNSEFPETGRHVGPGDLWKGLTGDGDNFLALKVTYWIPLL